MSLLKYAIAAAAGYYAATPAGRRQLEQLGQKAVELVRSPKAAELKERGREVVAERASAAVDQVRRTAADNSASGSATDAGDRPTAEDIQAAQTGVLPPGPASRASGGV